MAKNTAEKSLEFQTVYNTAESNWASKVINTLLTEAQDAGMNIPEDLTLYGVSMRRSQKDDGWDIGFHIRKKV